MSKTKELYIKAIETANKLPLNAKIEFEVFWFILNHKGKIYIGCNKAKDKFFKNRPAVSMLKKGKLIAYVQPLFKK